jgi:hypothetical protein
MTYLIQQQLLKISLDYFYSEEIVICADKDMLLTFCGT